MMNKLFDLELFFESSPDLLCVAGADGYFKKINAAVIVTLGYTREELFSRPIDAFIYAEDREMTALRRKNLIAGIPLLNFDNRYVTKSGELVWLSWTSVPIAGKNLIFAIAKNISYKKKIEEYRRIDAIMSKLDPTVHSTDLESMDQADQRWLVALESRIRQLLGKADITIGSLALEIGVSERQLFRKIKSATGLTPNKYIRIIRFHLAKEALKTGRYRTVAELSHIAGFRTPGYFSRLFKEVYGMEVNTFL